MIKKKGKGDFLHVIELRGFRRLVTMNSYERMINLFEGKPIDRLPAQPICMTFAARVAGVKYYDYVTDYRVLVEAQLKIYEEFGFDIVKRLE